MEKTIIENGIVLTMNPKRQIIKDGAVVVEGSEIVDVGDRVAMRKHKADVTIDAKNKIVMPGLVNLHFHPGTMIRGVGEHMGLEQWAQEILYPYLAAMEPRDAYLSAALAYSEALLTGTTTVNLMYAFINEMARAAEDIGIRAAVSSEAADLVEGQPTLAENEKAFKEIKSPSGRVKVWFGVEWLPICSDEFLIKARELADKYKTGIHIHLNESRGEVEACVGKFGKRPTVRAKEFGNVGPDVVAAHCVWLSDEEKKIFAETGTHISHNPVSNAKLGNGLSPVPELMKMGVNVGLGTDDSACNDSFQMFETMKYASIAQKAKLLDAAQMPALTVMEMATLNGAKALGLGDQIGSIEPGRKADIILIDLNVPNLRPIHFGEYSNMYQNLVYSSPGNAVDTVLVNGDVVVENGKLKTMNLEEIIEEHGRRSADLLERRKKYIRPLPI